MMNVYNVFGSAVHIYINRGPGIVAIIDLEDLPLVSSIEGTWSGIWSESSQTYYATHKSPTSCIYMHRLILGLTDPKIHTDHRDHNGLNNTRLNIRAVTQSVNKFNRRGLQEGGANVYRNVYWHKASQTWHVQIKRMKKYRSYGYFRNIEEAAKVAEMARGAINASEA